MKGEKLSISHLVKFDLFGDDRVLILFQVSMVNLYKHVLPALLRLACDPEQVARQLFEPLVLQLIHWFTGECHSNHDIMLN